MTNKNKIQLFIENYVPIIFLCVFAFILTIIQSRRFTPLIDYTYQVENAYRIFRGEIPYKDFFLVLTPGTYYLMALLMKINNGYNHQLQVIVSACLSGVSVFLIYFILQKLFNQKLLIFFLTLSAVFAGYVIYPFPIYNNDVVLFMLLSLSIIIILDWKKHSPIFFFIAGILTALPFLFKQNIGFAYLLLISAAYLLPEIIRNRYKNYPQILSYLGGVLFVFLFFIFWLVSNHTLGAFFYQTFTYPGQVRAPISAIKTVFYSMISVKYLITLPPLVAAFYINFKFKNKKYIKETLFFLLILCSILVIPYLSIFFYRYFVNGKILHDNLLDIIYQYSPESIWYTTILISTYFSIKNLREDPSFLNFLILACIGIIFSAFLSWGISSSISVWFLLLILVLYVVKNLSKTQKDTNWKILFSAIFIVITIILIDINYLLPFKSGWVASTEKAQVATIPRLKGMSIRGNYVSDMKNMIIYTNQNIPKSDKIVLISGEDPFYSTTDRINPLKFSQYGVNTYPVGLVVDDIVNSDAKWLIVKTKLQVNANQPNLYVDTSKITKDKEIEVNYKIYKVLPSYNIYIKSDN